MKTHRKSSISLRIYSKRTAVLVLTVLFTFFSIIVTAQNAKEIINNTVQINGLKVGDKMPDVTLTDVKNSDSKTIKISDLKGKLIILDFWNKWCTACIEAFPKMGDLQEKV